MTEYPIDMQLVVDPDNTQNVVANGEVWIYDPSDKDGVSPLALQDPSGLPLKQPLMSNAYGFLPPFISPVPRVKWKSGIFENFFYSYDGLRNEAIAARAAAEAAQGSAATAATEAAAAAEASLASAVADAKAAATAAANAAALVGAPADSAIAAAVNGNGVTKEALNARYGRTFRPETYGAIGDGVADDTAAIRDTFDDANRAARPGIVGTIQHPGATVELDGIYNLATLAEPIQVKCNVAKNQATFLIPAGYAGIAVQVGHPDSGGYFTNADISLPDVVKPTTNALPVAGSVGVRVQNLGSSELKFGRTYYFETGQHYTGWNQGTVYNVVNIGHVAYCKRSVVIKPDKAGAWANQNTFVGGGIQQSPGYAGGSRVAGWRHVIIDGNGINACDMNRFIGVSFEGDASEYHIEIRQAIHNKFEGNRFEQGTLGAAVTVDGATLTRAAHGLAVGDMVTFAAGTVPAGMLLAAPYFVATVPTADTFTVSFKKDGAALTFTTAGAGVTYFRPPRVLIDSALASNNTIEDYFAIQGALELVDPGASGSGNVITPTGIQIADNYSETDFPPYRGRNRRTGAVTRPIFAAYPPAVKPTDDPNGWTTALSDRGLLFATSGAEHGRIGAAGGALTWKRPVDGVSYEIPSARRTPALVGVSGMVVAAQTTAAFTFTLTGAAVNDHVNITMLSHVAGIAVSHGYVSAADTITVVFANLTAASITFNANLQAMATRRYY